MSDSPSDPPVRSQPPPMLDITVREIRTLEYWKDYVTCVNVWHKEVKEGPKRLSRVIAHRQVIQAQRKRG